MKKQTNDKVILIEQRVLVECMEFIENNSNYIYKTLNSLVKNKHSSFTELNDCIEKLNSICRISRNLKENDQLAASLETIWD